MNDEAVEGGAEDAIVVISVDEARVRHCLFGFNSVHDPLVEVCGGYVPRLGAEEHVVAVVDLGEMVERPALLRVWQCVCTKTNASKLVQFAALWADNWKESIL